MPLISIIIPAYNSEKTIGQTIQSALKQTFSDFELIIINDGSQDATIDIISNFKDLRIKTFSYPNAGLSISRSRGFERAVGEFISYLDADDLWTPNKLSSQLQALQNNPDAAVAYSWTDNIDAEGNFLEKGTHISLSGDVYQKLLVINFLENGSNPLIKRKAIEEVGGFDNSLPAAQDWDMWIRLAKKFKFVAVPSVQILYRISATSQSSNLLRQEKACILVFNKSFAQAPDSLRHLKNESRANLYKYLTWKALQEPYKRQKSLFGAIFLSKFVIYDSFRWQKMHLIIVLLFKILVTLILPNHLALVLLEKLNKISPFSGRAKKTV
ncbi:MAG: glycosyltransferase [Nostocaceae cyanobacterium]|nr:glycosyltransferase [Nostocaceae cyanobacterium]